MCGIGGLLLSPPGPVPLPCVLEGFDLRGRWRPIVFPEQHVVILIALEGRIEVDKINRFVIDVPAQHVEVVSPFAPSFTSSDTFESQTAVRLRAVRYFPFASPKAIAQNRICCVYPRPFPHSHFPGALELADSIPHVFFPRVQRLRQLEHVHGFAPLDGLCHVSLDSAG
jgi:hypothetical protein